MFADKTSHDSGSASSIVRGSIIIVFLFMFGVTATIVFDLYGWDLKWSGAFYTSGSGGWTHAREQPWRFFYDYGETPGIIALLGALSGCVAAKARKIKQQYMAPCLVVVLTVILGPGILVNGILKSYWGRPRPVDTTAFGGDSEFRKIRQPGIPGRGKSFPCGHCSMAFALSSGAAFFPYHPALGAAALVGGLAYGVLVGAARVIQGGHFPTDVLWAGVLVFMIIAALYYLVFRIPDTVRNKKANKPREP